MKRQSLSKFETMAQRLVEGSFKRLFGEQLELHDVAVRLARVMEDSQVDGQAADLYAVQLHSTDLAALTAKNPELSAAMADYLAKLAQQAGLLLLAPPQVTLKVDNAVRQHQILVQAAYSSQPEEPTTQVRTRAEIEAGVLAALRQRDAYLIVAGRQHVPLDMPLLTLGRRTDNDVVLDSAAVSRQHAQIRWRYGRFVLIDLSQRGRTLVNDQPVTQYALQPGDVFALSDTLIVYGEGRDGMERQLPERNDNEGVTKQLPKLQDDE